MAGLPAAGKTTTAARLHAAAGGGLIRSCDVFQDLGIDLPAWVQRTAGFTREAEAYEALRARAYTEMRRRLAASLAAGAAPVVVDAVHGEPDQRAAAYALCAGYGIVPLVVWCRCDDAAETARRLAARRGREAQPENEASDPSVFTQVRRRWRDPAGDRAPDGTAVPVVVHDTVRQAVHAANAAGVPWVAVLAGALAGTGPVAGPR